MPYQAKQAEILRGHSESYKENIQKASLTQTEAYWSYLLFLRPCLTYPLPCTSLTQKQYRAIQAPALAALLPKLHLNRHTPRAVLFGGLKYGGLDLPELYTDQGFGQLRLLIGHLKLRDEVGLQIICFLSELQLFIGTIQPVFTLPFSLYGHLVGDYWLVSIWKHLSQIGFTLEVEDAWCPTLPRQNDASIMELAFLHNFSPQQLREINSCRLYLQVITVSDIVNAQGTCILQSAIKGERESSRVSSLHWPNWQRPSSWNSWRRLLHHISIRGRLVQELGDWVSSTHQVWQWYYEASQDTDYHQRTSGQWVKYTRVQQLQLTRRSRTMYTSPQDCSPPSTMSLLFPTIRSLPSSSPMASNNQVGNTSLWPLDQVPLL
jgi:hypothetical protein